MKQLKEMFEGNELQEHLNLVSEGAVGDFFKRTFTYLKGKIAQVGKYFVALFNDKVLPAITPVTAQIAWKNGDFDADGLHMVADKASAKFSHITTNAMDCLKYRDGDTLKAWKSMKIHESILEDNNGINEARLSEYFGDMIDESRIDEELKLAHESGEIPSVDGNTLKAFIKVVLNNSNATPLLIWGAPGVGKTQVAKAVLKEVKGANANLLDFQLSIKEHDDFFLPSYEVDENGVKTKAIDLPKSYLPVWKDTPDMTPEERKAADDACGEGLIFLDELTQAKPSVQAVMLKLVADRVMGENYRLGSKWRIIAAANREQDMVTNNDWNAALGNRFKQVNYEPTVKTWRKWAETKGYMNAHILDWLEMNQKYFYHMGDTDNTMVPYATPRTWEYACRELAIFANTADDEGFDLFDIPDDIIEITLGSTVGMDTARAFMEYVRLARTINMDDLKKVFTDPDKTPLPKKSGSSYKVDLMYIITTQIVSLLTKAPTHDEMTNIMKYIARLNNESACGKFINAIATRFPETNGMWGEAEAYEEEVANNGEKAAQEKYPYYDACNIMIAAYPRYEKATEDSPF